MLKIDFEKAYDKVRWSFVEDVMMSNRFPQSWIDQVMCTVQGGKVCVNIIGDRTTYFNTYQELRQGDPLSPILFNIIVETLATLMRKTAGQGKIKGVLTHMIPEGITHV
jgi:hypothetical protein